MNRTFSIKINLLLIVALIMAPLQFTFASGSINFNHPIVCHMVNQVHTSQHDHAATHDAEQMQMQMMVDCEHATGMQHSSDSSCQADAQSGSTAVLMSNEVAAIPPPRKMFFSYHTSMVSGFVPLLEKPPQVTL